MSLKTTKIVVFNGHNIRKTLHRKEWWFVISDVVKTITDSKNPSEYIKDMRRRDSELSKGWGKFATPLYIDTTGGKQKINCANTEGLFRIIQSIPSPKAEPFKRWLAKVGYERVKEIEDPELATKRSKMLYKLKGYPEDWIEKRIRGMSIREELTNEWNKRGADANKDYEILTAEISKATFGVTPKEYKKLKGLRNENLRDHMNDFELIFTMLGERSTTEIHRIENSKGVDKLKQDSKRGGGIAGTARKELEKELGKPIDIKQKYLPQIKSKPH